MAIEKKSQPTGSIWERLTRYFDTGDERSNDSATVDAGCACDTTASLDAKERALSHLLRY
jgi:hypothetical protein